MLPQSCIQLRAGNTELPRGSRLRQKGPRPLPACDRERAVEQRLGDAALSLSRIGRDPDPEFTSLQRNSSLLACRRRG
jgi:hypothetical protein